MSLIHKILCPIDFSECSRAALEQALDLAERFGASANLVHICDVPRSMRPDLMVWMESGHARPMSEVALEQARTDLADFVAQIPKAAALACELRVGAPAETILEYAEAGGYDLIVMGTHGRRGLSHWLLGSVAEKVVRRSKCPVLTLREPAAAATAAE
jgi:nucleotide-binding universal stress UspA family protein